MNALRLALAGSPFASRHERAWACSASPRLARCCSTCCCCRAGWSCRFATCLIEPGFDVRVLATDAPPFAGPRIPNATAVETSIAALPEVETVVQLIVRDAEIVTDGRDDPGRPESEPQLEPMDDVAAAVASSSSAQIKKAGAIWTVIEGHDLPADPTEPPPLVVNRNLARRLALHPGSTLPLRGRCPSGDALPPIAFTITGIADFPFDDATAGTVAGRLPDTARLCQDAADDRADLLLVRSRAEAGADAARAAIHARQPGLHIVTNEDLVRAIQPG